MVNKSENERSFFTMESMKIHGEKIRFPGQIPLHALHVLHGGKSKKVKKISM
jgi:hypothetical protein